MDIIRLIREGGVVMYPLLICSFFVWAVIFEKLWSLAVFNRRFRKLHTKAVELVKDKKIDEAKGLYASADSIISAPNILVLDNLGDKKKFEEKLDRRLIETQLGLKRFMWILATIASSAPFIGLFGTVVGIIRSFDSMAHTGKGGFSIVASGLSEALVATAAGIFVAVIALVFYNYFSTRISESQVRFKNSIDELADHF